MTPSKVLLYVLGTVALLHSASAKPSAPKKHMPLGMKPQTQVGGGKEGIQSMQQVPKKIGQLVRKLGEWQDARRLQATPENTGMATYIGSYVNDDGMPSCAPDAHPVEEPGNIQPLIDNEMCIPSEEGSMNFGFDSHSVIVRSYLSSDCTGSRNVTAVPCGCIMGVRVEGHLCHDVAPPAAHFTIDMMAPGKCASSEWTYSVPVWEGCYHASMFISGDSIEVVKRRSRPEAEVYARVQSMGERMVYSLHNDTMCTTPPQEIFTTSCHCTPTQDDALMDVFSVGWHLTGEFCESARQPDVSFFMFERNPSSTCTAPSGQGSFWFGECHATPCPARDDCESQSYRARADPDPESKAIYVAEYHNSDCSGVPYWERHLGCWKCLDTHGWSEDDDDDDKDAQFLKVVGHYCAVHGGQCKKVPRSSIPSEIQEKLMPCLSEMTL